VEPANTTEIDAAVSSSQEPKQPWSVQEAKMTNVKAIDNALFDLFQTNKTRDQPANLQTLVLAISAKFGCLRVVSMLLSNKYASYVNPAHDEQCAVRWASTQGHVDVLKLLLTNKRSGTVSAMQDALRCASKRGHVEILKLLMSDKRVDPSMYESEALRKACEEGHVEIVKLLLKDYRVQSNAMNDEAVRAASMNGDVEVVRLLVGHQIKSLRGTSSLKEALRCACLRYVLANVFVLCRH
jgi:hypothetical protein